MKGWRKEAFGQIKILDLEEGNGGPTNGRICRKTWLVWREFFWEQKSRKTKLKDGNNNTKFFHRLANLHK